TLTQDVLGGDAAVDASGNITMGDDIGGTGESTIDEAIEYAAQGWDISANGSAGANVAPGGSVDFSNTDDNIEITQDGTDLAFNLNKDLDLTEEGSLAIGNSRLDNTGLSVDDGAGNSTTVGAG